MHLEGSCHCGSVKFSLESRTAMPYQRCYCSICRKTAGGGGYAINLMGQADTLEIAGEEYISVYRVVTEGRESSLERRFCKQCGSALWIYSAKWPELVHPCASAIDTPLPVPDQHVHLMLGSRASWVEVEEGSKDQYFDHYPELSIEEWHEFHAKSGDNV